MSVLGHVTFSGGIVVDLSKVDDMLQWETSKSVKEIKIFLGLASYYHIFIKGFLKLAMPLTQLAQKGQAYVWMSVVKRVCITQEKVDECSSFDSFEFNRTFRCVL